MALLPDAYRDRSCRFDCDEFAYLAETHGCATHVVQQAEPVDFGPASARAAPKAAADVGVATVSYRGLPGREAG